MTETAVDVRNEQVEIVRKRATDGTIRLYAGRQKDPLAELKLTTFGKPADGTITADAIIPDSSAKGTGKATRYVVFQDDGESEVWRGDVSGKSGDGSLKLDSQAIQRGAEVSLTSLTYTLPA